jgi:putative phosphonate metabolism protein
VDAFSRYAVYYAPRPSGALAAFGAAWLGRDAEDGGPVAPLELAGLPRPRDALTESPRRYGFHATLRAPFRLAAGRSAEQLDAAVAALAGRMAAFTLPMLRLEALGPFLALTPAAPSPQLDAAAAACVTELDGFRAATDARELARRRAAGLGAAEEANLARWGYPYVLETFQFHITLTGALAASERRATQAALAAALTPVLAEPARFDDLCLFGEAADGTFRVVARHALGARE